jgi:FAD:protein FMN transferase
LSYDSVDYLKRSSIAPVNKNGQPAMRFTLLLWLVSATIAQAANSEAVLLQGMAQGTTWHLKFVAPAKDFDSRSLQEDIEKKLSEIDRQMSTYRPDSEISRFNRAPPRVWVAVSAAVAEVVAASREISERTGGAQDVTVGPLVRLWHFGPRGVENAKTLAFVPPSEQEIRLARGRVGYTKLDVRMKPAALKKEVDGLEVDLSSIAAGYSVDRLAEIMRDHGIKNFMLELGGELRAAGTRADGMPWRVAIERPLADKREMAAAVPLVDAAMATAGGSRHFFEHEGRRYSHIIDPATGRPVEHTLASVTVAADKCVDADGWDTPLTVLGPERGTECAEKYGIAAMFVSHVDGDKEDEVRTTAAWRKRFGGK